MCVGPCTLIWKKKVRDNVFLMLFKGGKVLKDFTVEFKAIGELYGEIIHGFWQVQEKYALAIF